MVPGNRINPEWEAKETEDREYKYTIIISLLSSPTFSVSVTSPDDTFVIQCLVCGLRRRERRAVDRVYPGPLHSFATYYLIVIITRWLFCRWDIGFSIVRSFGNECEVLSFVDISSKQQNTISGRTTTSGTWAHIFGLHNDFVTRGVIKLVHVELTLR